LAGWAGLAVMAVGGGAVGQACLVGVELGQGDVAGVGVGDEGDPLLAGCDRFGVDLSVGTVQVAVAAEAERAGVAGVVQGAQDGRVGQRGPVEFALAGAVAVAAGEEQTGVLEGLDDRVGRPGGGEGGEQVAHGVADGDVRVQDDLAGRVVDQADGEWGDQWGDQFAAAGLVQYAAAHAGAEEVQFGLLCGPRRYADHGAVGGRW
jgi:hypothetical protein